MSPASPCAPCVPPRQAVPAVGGGRGCGKAAHQAPFWFHLTTGLSSSAKAISGAEERRPTIPRRAGAEMCSADEPARSSASEAKSIFARVDFASAPSPSFDVTLLVRVLSPWFVAW